MAPQCTAHCYWCVQKRARREMFKLRDGPIDWYFCDEAHARKWLDCRHRKETARLCRMLPQERQEHLQGRSMEQAISSLLADAVPGGR